MDRIHTTFRFELILELTPEVRLVRICRLSHKPRSENHFVKVISAIMSLLSLSLSLF